MGAEAPKQIKRQLSPFTIASRKLGEIIIKPFGYKMYYDLEGLKKITVDQISSSQHYAQIIEGRFDSKVYNDDGVISALEKAIERGVKIELVGGPVLDLESTRLWEMVNNGKIDFYQHEISPKTHSTVVDGEHIRFEYPHSPLETSRRGFSARAINESSLILETLNAFDDIRSEAIKVKRVAIAQPYPEFPPASE